jgi:hypothetical protein
MERFLYFSIGCLFVAAVFSHIYMWNKGKKSVSETISEKMNVQQDWIKGLSNQIDDMSAQLHSCYRIHDEKLEELKKLTESNLPKITEPTEPKIFKEHNWKNMKRAFCVPGTKVDVDE